MTTINLYQNKDENEKKSFFQGISSGFFFSLGMLGVVLLVLFGLKFYIPILEEKNNELTLIVENENARLVGLKNLEQIVDMQTRIGAIKSNLQINKKEILRVEMSQILDKLSLDVNDNIVISGYSYDKNRVSVDFTAKNFSDASKQIFNFKQSKYFKDVNLSNISRGESGITCKIEMSI